MTKNIQNTTYLDRLKDRKLNKEVKDCAAFGIFFGGVLFLLSAWFHLFSDVPHQTMWHYLLRISLLMMILGLVIPQSLYYPQKIVSSFGNFVFTTIFKGLLLILYFIIIYPTAIIFGKNINSTFYYWKDINTVCSEGWSDKVFNYAYANTLKGHNNVLLRSLNILNFFIQKKLWFLIPAIIAILIFGLVFSFIQSSLIAPLIYTIL